jgi:hypothetical protein
MHNIWYFSFKISLVYSKRRCKCCCSFGVRTMVRTCLSVGRLGRDHFKFGLRSWVIPGYRVVSMGDCGCRKHSKKSNRILLLKCNNSAWLFSKPWAGDEVALILGRFPTPVSYNPCLWKPVILMGHIHAYLISMPVILMGLYFWGQDILIFNEWKWLWGREWRQEDWCMSILIRTLVPRVENIWSRQMDFCSWLWMVLYFYHIGRPGILGMGWGTWVCYNFAYGGLAFQKIDKVYIDFLHKSCCIYIYIEADTAINSLTKSLKIANSWTQNKFLIKRFCCPRSLI